MVKLTLAALLPLSVALLARLSGPEDLDGNDQAKQALYVLDIWQHGRWILPRERDEEWATKPPLYAWLCVGASVAGGGPTELGCRLVSAVATLAVGILILRLGSEWGGPRVGLAAAWIFAAAHTVAKLCTHVRPDMVLTVATTCALLALFRLGEGRSRGMAALFWMGASLSILAKGLAGPLVVFGSLGGLWLTREWRPVVKTLLRSPWVLALALPALWFALAIGQGGMEYLRENVLPETLGTVVVTSTQEPTGQLWGTLLLVFVGRFAPWSVLALAAAGTALAGRKDPARRVELLLSVWLLSGLLLFNLLRKQREDYLLPLLPAASLLIAGALDRPQGKLVTRLWSVFLAVGPVLGLAGAAAVAFVPRLPGLGDTLPHARTSLALALVGASVLLFAAWRRAPRAAGASRITRSFFAASLGVLVLTLAYKTWLSPEALAARGVDLRAFAAQVKAERRAGDEVEFVGGLGNAIRFLLGENKASLEPAEVVRRKGTAAGGGRLLLVSDAAAREALLGLAPERFRVLLERPHGRKGGRFVLLESVASVP